jgi:hypothetical protein
MAILDLTNAPDGMDSKWWILISSNFGFKSLHGDLTQIKADENYLLIHKKMIEGQRFPEVHYYIVMNDTLLFVEYKDFKKAMFDNLLNYVDKNQKLPFSCRTGQVYKNGSVQILYEPNQFDVFPFKITTDDWMVGGTMTIGEYFQKIKVDTFNDLIGSEVKQQEFSIKKIPIQGVLQITASEVMGKVSVSNAKVTEINRRTETYQEHEKEYYMLRIEDFDVASTETSIKRHVDLANLKLSTNAVDKFQVKVGDIINFKGELKSTKYTGVLLQNVRSVTKN